jgi:hypothetical protein
MERQTFFQVGLQFNILYKDVQWKRADMGLI